MKEDRSTGLNRRKMLGGMTSVTGLVITGGCSEIQSRVWSQPGAGDVILYNQAEDAKTVEVTITGQSEDEAHTARTLEIAPGEEINPVNNSKLPLNTSYTVEATLEESGVNETFEWDDPDVSQAPLWILVDDTRNIKFLLQAG